MDDGDETFHENEYSWNKNASMLYLEMPAGVGFSYCNKTEWSTDNCTYVDTNTAEENLVALRAWFERFPDYKTKDLYLSGESYAGIYVPYLMHQIDQYNQNNTDVAINLKGMMVGNGVTNWTFDALPGTVDMAYWHSLISQEVHDGILEEGCDFSGIEFEKYPSDKCLDYLQKVNNDISKINIYNIYGECYGGAP